MSAYAQESRFGQDFTPGQSGPQEILRSACPKAPRRTFAACPGGKATELTAENSNRNEKKSNVIEARDVKPVTMTGASFNNSNEAMPASVQRRRTPEELLKQAQAEEAYERRGKLKVFLGYASGVGKSFRMLDEARRRAERGQDVVVGATQPKTTPDLEAVLKKLEVIALEDIDGVPVMDLPAILKRHPGVCLVDGLAYD